MENWSEKTRPLKVLCSRSFYILFYILFFDISENERHGVAWNFMQPQVVLWVKYCPLWSYVGFLSSLLEMILQDDFELQKRSPVK